MTKSSLPPSCSPHVIFFRSSSLLLLSALPPCLSYSHKRTFKETLQTCLFALLIFPKTLTAEPGDALQLTFPRKTNFQRLRMELAVNLFPHMHHHRGWDFPSRVCSSTWQQDGYDNVVVTELSELCCGGVWSSQATWSIKLSITQPHFVFLNQ